MIKWTNEQQSVITTRNADLLVSASAGSGKTTVMIERIAQMIAGAEVDLSQILVLTFTRASAADMRAKLRRKLEETVKEDLSAQLGAAAIGTFHGYCQNLIKANFNVIGLDPAMAVLDDVDAGILKSELLDQIIAENYDRCRAAIDTFCVTRRTDGLKNLVGEIANFLSSRRDAIEWLENIALGAYSDDFENNPAVANILNFYNSLGEHYHGIFQSFMIAAEHEGAAKAIPFIEHAKEMAQKLRDAKRYEGLLLDNTFTTLNARDFSEKEEFKKNRDEFKKHLKKIWDDFPKTKKDVINGQKRDKRVVGQVIHLVKTFITRYNTEKERAGKIDFSDMERHALAILAIPEIAECEKSKFKYIFVDEYQDTNPVQEEILSRIAGDKNTFAVGDAKQSIYGFRGTEVAIFTGRLDDNRLHVIKLNENFRSEPGILDFVNRVFGRVMTTALGLDYNLTSQFKIPPQKTDAVPVEIILLDTKKDDEDEGEQEKSTTPYDITADEPREPDPGKIQIQCEKVSMRIAELMKSDPRLKLSDIVILARKKTHFAALQQALAKRDIESAVEREQNAHELFEIAVLENFLFAISNFENDLPLVRTMTTFVFGFTADELAQIKINGAGDNWYQRLQNDPNEKAKDFLDVLSEFHILAKRNDVADLLNMFIARFSIMEKLLLLENGEERVQNVYRYLNKLRGMSVARYVYLVENEMLQIKLAAGGGTRDRVQIMTIHKSKGLEFPIVILFTTENDLDDPPMEKSRIIMIDRDCGLCMLHTDSISRTKSKSIATIGAKHALDKFKVMEELRLLYVALTRAKGRLIIVGSLNVDRIRQNIPTTDFMVSQSKSYFNMMAPTIFKTIPDCEFKLTVTPIDDIKIIETPHIPRALGNETCAKTISKYKRIFDHEKVEHVGTHTVLKNSVTSLTRAEEATADHTAETMPFVRDRGADYGTAFHNGMMMAIAGRTDIDQLVGSDVEKCLGIIREFLPNMKLHAEVPFIQRIDDILVQGVIDLLATSADRTIMIDYKTTRANEAELVERYAPQLNMYKSAIEAATGKKVEAYIYGTRLAKLIRV
ncbi:MAG: UvrD-helicase domain-containing protein [Firmicutes bacterium]|nr:UvrD-helicase domain-containing protein [Bacillota bacterium]